MTDAEFLATLTVPQRAYAENALHQRDDAVTRANNLAAALASARVDRDAALAQLAESEAIIEAAGGVAAARRLMAQRRVRDLQAQQTAVADALAQATADAGV